jgi:hypothetical protein
MTRGVQMAQPAGAYIGWEDLPHGSSDEDYNDDQYIFVNVSLKQIALRSARIVAPLHSPSSDGRSSSALWSAADAVSDRVYSCSPGGESEPLIMRRA